MHRLSVTSSSAVAWLTLQIVDTNLLRKKKTHWCQLMCTTILTACLLRRRLHTHAHTHTHNYRVTRHNVRRLAIYLSVSLTQLNEQDTVVVVTVHCTDRPAGRAASLVQHLRHRLLFEHGGSAVAGSWTDTNRAGGGVGDRGGESVRERDRVGRDGQGTQGRGGGCKGKNEARLCLIVRQCDGVDDGVMDDRKPPVRVKIFKNKFFRASSWQCNYLCRNGYIYVFATAKIPTKHTCMHTYMSVSENYIVLITNW